ncbi:nucleolar protein 53 [[Emmonsia] crescens]|uniref:RNA exonuclease 4 n=1 Tax=[Emmonsia] crescens TaxID=73230 RepID=A0A2B7ZR48_9EURO|nr:nucleolar protein 53 [Emmonsia crescens]
MELKNLSSNWRKLQETLKKDSPSTAQKRKANTPATTYEVKRKRTSLSSPSVADRKGGRGEKLFKRRKMGLVLSTDAKRVEETEKHAIATVSQRNGSTTSIVRTKSKTSSEAKINEGLSPTAEVGKYVALDCEMVGVGPNPDRDSALARVSVVNYNGEQVYDSFVRPKETVTDWRTHVSGVSFKHMTDAREFEVVQKEVAGILDSSILIGHAVRNDLDALLLSHPKRDIRDTSKHPPYRKIAGGSSPRLKILASELLGLEIQGAAHSSIEDAQATMLLFRRDKEAFEREHAKKWPPIRAPADKDGQEADSSGKKRRKGKKKKGKK